MEVERSYEYGDIRTETCPYCGSEDFDSADWCNNCHQELKKSDEMLCSKCYLRLHQKWRNFLFSLSVIERNELDDWLDGRSVDDFT